MDTLFIEGLRVEAVIGVHDWERTIRQPLIFDLELATSITAAVATDTLAQTVDYFAVAERLRGFVEASEFQLIEALAEAVAALLLTEFSIPRLKLTLRKLGAVPYASAVGVRIERSRNG